MTNTKLITHKELYVSTRKNTKEKNGKGCKQETHKRIKKKLLIIITFIYLLVREMTLIIKECKLNDISIMLSKMKN